MVEGSDKMITVKLNIPNTWLVVGAGGKEYCINSQYVKGIAELDGKDYKANTKKLDVNSLIKGEYTIYGNILKVLDLRRVLGSNSIDYEKLLATEEMHKIIYAHMAWVDELELAILTTEETSINLDIKQSKELELLSKLDIGQEGKMKGMVKSINKALKIIYNTANNLLDSRKNRELTTEDLSKLTELKRQSKMYIVKNLEKILKIRNESIKETCLMVEVKNIAFAISVDYVDTITNGDDNIIRKTKEKLSAGTIKVKSKDYEIIDLTKLMNLIKVEGGNGKAAGVCYLKDSYNNILIEGKAKSEIRADKTLELGHHSILDHSNITLLIEGIPKIVAMILNNTQYYTTSEKSARYTQMEPGTGLESSLYHKWVGKFENIIGSDNPKIDSSTRNKLAMENARYLISVFTPTTMIYTTSHRQLDYIINWLDSYGEHLEGEGLVGEFYDKLLEVINEFKTELTDKLPEPLIKDIKSRGFDLITSDIGNGFEVVTDVYRVYYKATFAEVAQAQRHRTINHQIKVGEQESAEYYVPPIIRGTRHENDWIGDIKSLASIYPQGTLVEVAERGTFENFILKAKERLCGRAQLEITNITEESLKTFIDSKENLSEKNQALLERNTYDNKPCAKCLMDNFQCKEVCTWGSKYGLNRNI